MPFKSENQRRFLWAKHPEIAKRWTKEHGSTPVGKKSRTEAIERRTKRVNKHSETSAS